MDVAPQGTPNGHTVLLLHGNNFGGFYFKAIIDGLTKEGFRVITPDQIGYGRSSKPIAPFNFNSQARNTWRILQHEKIEKVMVIGHSMGGMLAARFATQFPKSVERVVIYNPIGLTDGRFERPMTPIDEAYQQNLKTDYQSTRTGLSRYVAHDPEGVEPGVRDLHAHPLLVDAQRRLAAPGDGAGPDRPDALRRPGRLRLGAHPGADAGVRRRRGHAARPGQELPGPDGRSWPRASPTATAGCCCCPGSATCRTSRRPTR